MPDLAFLATALTTGYHSMPRLRDVDLVNALAQFEVVVCAVTTPFGESLLPERLVEEVPTPRVVYDAVPADVPAGRDVGRY
jgi:hypothetical protein